MDLAKATLESLATSLLDGNLQADEIPLGRRKGAVKRAELLKKQRAAAKARAAKAAKAAKKEAEENASKK